MSRLLADVGAVPLEPGRVQAQTYLRSELAGQEYQKAKPGHLEAAIQWLWDRLSGLDLSGGGAVRPEVTAIALTLVVAAVGYALWRSGGMRRAARRAPLTVLSGDVRSARQHREQAERHAAAGDWDGAVVARFRAVARSLEERGILAPQPGRTAREVALDAAAALPGAAPDLSTAAAAFDQVSYGHRHLDEATYAAVRALDERLALAQAHR